MTTRPASLTVSVRRRAALVVAAGLVAASAVLATPSAHAADVDRGAPVSLVASPVHVSMVETGGGVVQQASTTTPEASTSPSGGYAWLAAAGFVLLVVGSIGRIVGLRILYKNRKNKGL